MVWKDGVVVTTANTKDAAYATSFFSLTGIKAPQFEFVNPVYQQYIDLDPNTGSFKLNEAGRSFFVNRTTVEVRVKLDSRFGTVNGSNDNIIKVDVDI